MGTDRPIDRPTARSLADSPEFRLYTETAAMTGGVFLGLGVGGFIDGIVLHQIAQWHSMGSAILPPTTMEAMAQNMRWDGYFHVVTLILTLIGAVSLWREGLSGVAPPSFRILTGQMLLGWGVFNLVEGLVAHVLLELHHVRDLPMHMPLYDWVLLGVGGFFFILFGWLLSRTTEADFRFRNSR
jgi:uncharacterized membrane protein